MTAIRGNPHTVRLDQANRRLVLEWRDVLVALPYALLRAQCPCATCRQQRHGGRVPPPDVPVLLAEARPMGPNALQLVFTDGHERGIYPFDYLGSFAQRAA